MDKSFFNDVKIFDGGMGQELLARGLETKGSLWSATALIDDRYHKMIIDTHLDFIKAGANIIVTNNFSARRTRMVENNTNYLFDYANRKAGELAFKARELSNKDVLIAGSLPGQNNTYQKDERNIKEIEKNFYDQAICLKPYIDFYYLDVLSSLRECEIALKVTEKIEIPTLVGLHLKSDNFLPSGEKISTVVSKCKKYNILGVMLSCVSPEIITIAIEELKELGIPFGFKANLWERQDPLPHTAWLKGPNETGINPREILGSRDDYTDYMFLNFSKKMIQKGATIIGGCCEINPQHINKVSQLVN
ncbi:MAG: homocysteine S-methyltransferase [Pelagibacteraceae bacterium]|nr:homocysteine S-methyltransferase [Pelagibacteraceae bacterium]